MADIAFASAKKLAALIRTRKVGCLELLDHMIDRVEQFDTRINAIVVRDFDRARRRARALDRKQVTTGRLHGVPMTVKESFDVAGLPSTWGHPGKRENLAQRDALAVQRLLDSGAVVFGKTNVPHMLADWQSFNDIHGTTNNPWDTSRSPGGSSGGSAAALAAGLTGLEIGSDIGGSIRQPAHACGVFGHKPSWGLCPPFGHSLSGAAAMTDISVIGPLARSADDLAIALDIIAGPDPVESALRMQLPPPAATNLRDLRVAVWAEQPGHATDPEITAALQTLARFLRRAGAKVSLTARPEFDPTAAFHVYLKLLHAALSGRANAEELDRTRRHVALLSDDDLSADAVMARGVDLLHRDWLKVNEHRHRIRRAWGAFFQDWHVLICPVIATPALPHMQEGQTWERRMSVGGQEIPYNDMLFWPGLTGGFHLPATATPIGITKSGLPIGAQIVGRLHDDRTTIEVARLLEKQWRGFEPPEGWE